MSIVSPRRPPARRLAPWLALVSAASLISASLAAVVPNELQMPGTQPFEVQPLEASYSCETCHGQYDPAVEPFENWSGSMMAHAGRDPLFWAALAVAEQDFAGSGDLCLRCHAPSAWYDGRSTPTDGSALAPDDFDGVNCDLCHKLTDPDDSEHVGEQYPPFEAHDGGTPAIAHRGSGQASLWGGYEKMGPYANPNAFHGFLQSQFHRRSDLCGTCHDVSNPLTGDLAPSNGAMTPLAPGTFSGTLGGPLASKAALNNFPHAYGVVERTFSEHVASPFETMSVADFPKLPVDLRKGSLADAYRKAKLSTPTGDYEDGAPRAFTCQTCHMEPVTGYGCGIPGTPLRTDVPLHDLTGGNYWAPDAILYLDSQNRLVGGNGLTFVQQAGLQRGKLRAIDNLKEAAALSVEGNVLTVTNLTGHKLISGYPEGRRMWIRVTWYDAAGQIVREDGEYGPKLVRVGGQPYTVDTLLDAGDPYTKVYGAEMAITQEWAAKLLTLGVPSSLPVAFHPTTGALAKTLGQVAAQAPGTHHPSFHFVLNDKVAHDNRIPPYRMSRDEAFERNAQPVPATQFGDPAPGGHYLHYDEVPLSPPAGAVRADVRLMYQPTSFEYVQFLVLANNGSNPFHATLGDDVFEAWRNTGMAAPVVMAEARWGTSAPVVYCTPKTNSLGCVPEIGSSGVPSASAGEGFYVTCADVLNNRAGMLRVSTSGPNATPFKGGFNCIAGPAARAGYQLSGGNAFPSDCSGGYVIDLNAFIASGVMPTLVPGATAWMQWWSRDAGFAAPNNYGLSAGMRIVVGP
jgi:hypothetical protein